MQIIFKEFKMKNILEKAGGFGGGLLGFSSISAIISTSGAVTGLSAAGITSGLATVGTVVGGGMMAGVVVSAAIPIAGVAVGVGIIKGINKLTQSKNGI